MRDTGGHEWILLVEGYLKRGDPHKLFGQRQLGTVRGTRAEADEELWRQIHGFQPPWPWHVSRWAVYEDGDGYVACYRGRAGGEHLYGFRMVRRVWWSWWDQDGDD